MRPRITVNLTADGEFQIWVNQQGRDVLVRELQGLSERNDHFHLGPKGLAKVEVSFVSYNASDKVLGFGKILFRTDEWDKQHFPHVLDGDADTRP